MITALSGRRCGFRRLFFVRQEGQNREQAIVISRGRNAPEVEMKKMSYDRFCESLVRCLREKLGAGGNEPAVSVRSIENEDGRRDILFITGREEKDSLSPGAELHSLYKEYLKGCRVEMLGNLVCSSCMPQKNGNLLRFIRDYDYARNNMFIRVRGRQNMGNFIPGSPYQEIEDLVLTYHIRVSEKSDSLSSIMISREILEELSVTSGKLQRDALQNAMRIYPPKIRKITDILGDDGSFKAGKNILVVTNSSGMNGAAALFYPGVMEQTARMAGGDFYALPSSIHEFVILPDRDTGSAEELASMVAAINRAVVSPEDVLSDSVYHYSHEARIFELAEHYEQRRAEAALS